MDRRKSAGYIIVRMNENLAKRVDNVCKEYGISRAQLVKILLVHYLDQQQILDKMRLKNI